MRNNKIFRILALAIIFALLIAAVPVSPVLAYSERISVSPTKGEVGDDIDVDGYDFDPDEDGVDVYFTSEEVDEDDDLDDLDVYEQLKSGANIGEEGDDDEGEFVAYNCEVPETMDDGDEEEDVTGGTYYVFVTYEDDDKIVAVDEFSIIGISISPTKGQVGTKVKITGSGFGTKDDITITYDGDDVDIEDGDDETDSDGDFTSYILIPESDEGDHTIKVEIHNDEAEADFTVEPKVTISPTEGPPATKVTVTGTGFAKGKDVAISFDGEEVATGEADSDGSLEATFDVPAVGPGEYDVEVEDDDGNKAEAKFTMSVSINLSPTAGNVDTSLTVSGTAFIAGKTITINYDTTNIATTTVASDGTFTATFPAPASKAGSHTITATDGTSTLTATFTMESTPPKIPVPKLPEQKTKAKAEASFDWESVDDPSGVTYTLEIATDKSFAGDSLVLGRAGLTESEYTLTKEEKLESTKKDEPYYWRVKAIDGAGNESDWTGVGSFYVGFTFELGGWLIYLLIGIGGILLLIIGIFLGRRTAYY